MTAVQRTGKQATGITTSSAPLVTCAGHGLLNGDVVILMGAVFGLSLDAQTVPLDGRQSTVAVVDADHFTLVGADTSKLAPWSTGGEILKVVAAPAVGLTTLDKVLDEVNLKGLPVTGVTRANPGVVECMNHNLGQNDEVVFSKVRGMVELNGQNLVVTPIDSDHFSIGIDTTNLTAYAGGGFVSTESTYLAEQIVDQSAWLMRQMARPPMLMAQEYVDVYNGTGGRSLDPFVTPIITVSSLTIDNQQVPRRPFAGSPGWTWLNDRVLLDDYATGNPFPGDYAPYYVDGSRWRFTRGAGNVVLRYEAGVASVPQEIDRAVVELVAYRYRNRDRIGIRSRNLPGGQGGENVTYMVDDCPPSVKAVIDRYFIPSLS